MGRYVIDERARSQASREAVWSLLADIDTWSEWGAWQTSGLEREGSSTPGGVGAIRRMIRRPVTTREEVTEFDPPNRMGYKMLSGLPLRDYHGQVTLTDAPEGTEIHWRTEFDAKIPGTGALLRRQLGSFIADTAERVAREAERRAAPRH